MIELAAPPAIIKPANGLWKPAAPAILRGKDLIFPRTNAMLMVNQLIGFGVAAVPNIAILESFATTGSTGTTTRTFTSVTVSAARTHLLIGVASRGDGVISQITSMTANGISCTQIGEQAAASGIQSVELWAVADGSGGTSLSIVAVFDNNPVRAIGMAGVSLTGLQSLTPTSTGADTTDPLATTVNVDIGGVAFYIASAYDNAGAPPFTPSGVSEIADSAMAGAFGTYNGYSAGASVFATAQSGLSIGADPVGTIGEPTFFGASFR